METRQHRGTATQGHGVTGTRQHSGKTAEPIAKATSRARPGKATPQHNQWTRQPGATPSYVGLASQGMVPEPHSEPGPGRIPVGRYGSPLRTEHPGNWTPGGSSLARDIEKPRNAGAASPRLVPWSSATPSSSFSSCSWSKPASGAGSRTRCHTSGEVQPARHPPQAGQTVLPVNVVHPEVAVLQTEPCVLAYPYSLCQQPDPLSPYCLAHDPSWSSSSVVKGIISPVHTSNISQGHLSCSCGSLICEDGKCESEAPRTRSTRPTRREPSCPCVDTIGTDSLPCLRPGDKNGVAIGKRASPIGVPIVVHSTWVKTAQTYGAPGTRRTCCRNHQSWHALSGQGPILREEHQ